VRALGYLTADEIGYVLTRAGYKDVSSALKSPTARQAVRAGRRKATSEIATPPLRNARWWRKLIYGMRRKGSAGGIGAIAGPPAYTFESEAVVFPCSTCCQRMRLPLFRTVTATCPTCSAQLECTT
jgi:hypothetical protein